MRFSKRLFLVAFLALGVGALFPLPIAAIRALSPADAAALSLLVALGMAAEALPARYAVSGSAASSSVTFIPIFSIVLLFGDNIAPTAVLFIYFVSIIVLRHSSAYAKAFNIAQILIAVRCAEVIFQATDALLNRIPGHQLVAVLVMALAFFIVNASSVSAYLRIINKAHLKESFWHVIGPGGSNLYYDILVSPLALLLSSIYRDMGAIGIIVLLLPLYIIRHSYLAMLKLQHANNALLKVLIKAIETRDPYTSGHSVRVSLLARAIAEDMGLHGHVDKIESTALLHDIGKVDGVYAELIRKPHSLSSEEVQVIRTHATNGADFLSNLHTFDEFVIAGIRHHHEKYDGSGYPDGLAGDAIPLAARIIQISDSIDAMLSDRPYRKALSLEKVHAELRRCSGTQFDPDIVEVMFRKGTLRRMLPALVEHGGGGKEQRASLVEASRTPHVVEPTAAGLQAGL